MAEISCPRCHTGLSEAAKFCHVCTQPVRCQQCLTPILLGARICSECGKPVPDPLLGESPLATTMNVLPGYNHLKIHETPDERDIDLLLSNEAIQHLGDVLPHLIVPRIAHNSQAAADHPQTGQGTVVEVPSEEVAPLPQLPAAPASAAPNKQHTSVVTTSEEDIWQIFSQDEEEKLIQEMPALKATSKKDYAVRLAHLYLFAKHKLGVDKVPRAEVFDILKEAAVMDTNVYQFLPNETGIQSLDGGYLRLNLDGRTKAQRFAADVLNPDSPDGWLPGEGKRVVHNRGKKSSRKAGEPHTSGDVSVNAWATHEMTQRLKAAIPYKWSS
jgi:hypothetical protein